MNDMVILSCVSMSPMDRAAPSIEESDIDLSPGEIELF